ncbi:hypothetical protein NEUTE1DRAFT_47078 [Neurospora tetrasperma FGSC 2508]|uniref:Uncharacterized protein n=1 Tax=Neurospora tetrasperma (strain FGSC 2508 / ATCC MYA-4615 / P0657) TaxID=510951 RepID=F8MRX9_NEUT8|nr:uncharacterized protein NEUTE1DRAFT_47078 [Neurospora tetrasperma FGSC 2508]EGO54973.1 hypothetical protein NEUTE1DRAFT_47078 [Neurospora tetrasperma FGSC 2508]EGZ69836.1 hypothetical protein NEUTE2DRAFT_70594 [Neurospora tetrasperma FGSC 2509]
MDSNYLSRIRSRQEILSLHAAEVMGVLPEGQAAVKELYTYLLGEYLPVRYPTMFRIVSSYPGCPDTTFQNLITNSSSPLSPPPSDPLDCLRVIAQTVEDDFFLLLPFPKPNSLTTSEMEHKCVAFMNLHPSGFSPSSKLGLPLSHIHAPVPSYEKIGPSMERFFARLSCDKLVKRMNWAMQLHPDLYCPGGNHVHQEDLETMEEVTEFGDEEAEKARLRVELQGVWRLRKTGAVVFGFKTYMYGLREVKEEVLEMEDGGTTKTGEALAQAIEGSGEGNAPGMWTYKGAVRWGAAVARWLRS